MPFTGNSFDFCQCSSVLEYCFEASIRAKVLHQEMVRLVSPQGLLFFSVPNRFIRLKFTRANGGGITFRSGSMPAPWTARSGRSGNSPAPVS